MIKLDWESGVAAKDWFKVFKKDGLRSWNFEVKELYVTSSHDFVRSTKNNLILVLEKILRCQSFLGVKVAESTFF